MFDGFVAVVCLNHWLEFYCFLVFSVIFNYKSVFYVGIFYVWLEPIWTYSDGFYVSVDKKTPCFLLSVFLLCCVSLRGLFRKYIGCGWDQARLQLKHFHSIRQIPQLWELLIKCLDLSCLVLEKLWLMPID